MKLRILDDAIRLRLDRSEVDAIGAGDPVIACTRFPDGTTFGYELHPGETTGASFADGIMKVIVARDEADRWASDDTAVSIRGVQGLLIEKDFECLDPREGESQANRFPNPKAEN